MFSRLDLARAGLALFAATLTACGEVNYLSPASMPTYEDTVTLWAATGTAVELPSAFDLIGVTVVRTDRTNLFDFLFDLRTDSTGDTVAFLVPRGALGLSDDAGLQRVAARFDTLYLAPSGGYEFHAEVPVDTGTVLFARSRLQTCNFGLSYGIYAKLQPLVISRRERWMKIRFRLDPNCGYRGLGEGVPGR